VVGAVAGGELVVTPEMLGRLASSGTPRYLLDLAHPRNFDPSLSDVPGVRLIDLEDVFEQVEAARDARAAQIPEAERIVRQQADEFVRWQRSRESVRMLKAVRDQVLDVARAEAERFARGRTLEEREEVARFARTLARTLLHSPTVALRRADSSSPEGRALLENAGVLFGVRTDGSDPAESP
jgi:glutamyl-tRNA reductase